MVTAVLSAVGAVVLSVVGPLIADVVTKRSEKIRNNMVFEDTRITSESEMRIQESIDRNREEMNQALYSHLSHDERQNKMIINDLVYAANKGYVFALYGKKMDINNYRISSGWVDVNGVPKLLTKDERYIIELHVKGDPGQATAAMVFLIQSSEEFIKLQKYDFKLSSGRIISLVNSDKRATIAADINTVKATLKARLVH